MEHSFDLLSKQMASAVTRRDAARILTKGLFGVFITGAGLRRLWGLPEASTITAFQNNSSFCPDCGTCQVLNAKTGKVHDCSDKCMAQKLCNAAQHDADYQMLQSYLINSRSYQFQSYRALIVLDGTSKTTSFVANFVGQFNGQTAALDIAQSSTGSALAASVEYLNGVPVYAYAVSNGNIVEILPYQFENNPLSHASERISSESTEPSDSGEYLLSAEQQLPLSKCNTVLELVCRAGSGELKICLSLAGAACKGLVKIPELFAACFTAVSVTCLSVDCRKLANNVCYCIGGDVPCGQSLICSLACPAGYDCTSGLCVSDCGSGNIPCGDICCSPSNGAYCCHCEKYNTWCCCPNDQCSLGCNPVDCVHYCI
jgi:hypothetical protein